MTLQEREDSAVCATSSRVTVPEGRSLFMNVSFQMENFGTSKGSLNGLYGRKKTGFIYSQWMAEAGLMLLESVFNLKILSISTWDETVQKSGRAEERK